MIFVIFGKHITDRLGTIQQIYDMCQERKLTWRYLQSHAENVIIKGDVRELLDELGIKPTISIPYLH
jgi:hypothetical protein